MKIIALCFSLTCVLGSIPLAWLVLHYGWGLRPVSWPWILGGALFQVVVLSVSELLKRVE